MISRRPSLPRRRLRTTAAVSLALVASVVIAGCGGSEKAGDDKPDSQSTEDGTTLSAVWPLTGLPVEGSTPTHPVMIVKIDNTYASKPQRGLGAADMVVEELVEGGITRLAALFYSKLPPVAGPVRSARASDIGVVKPTHAVLIASGMAPPTKARLNEAGVKYYEMDAPGVYRDAGDPDHDYLHSVFVKLGELARSIDKVDQPPAAYLPWGSEEEFTGVSPATNLSVRFSNATTTNFRFNANAKKYLNTNTYAGRGDEFKADSVLVLRVREGDAGYRDPAGNPVPETFFFGTGNALLFHNGQVVRATWTKAKRDSALELSTAAGPLTVPAGRVWIELLPRDVDGGKVTFR